MAAVKDGNKPSGVAVRLSDVVKQWDSRPAVDRVSIDMEPGSFTVLVGPSGCGKSTTLRMIAGLEIPDSGLIEIGGADVTDLPPSKRNISMVFQSYALFPHLTVAENIVFGLRSRGVQRSERDEKLRQTADLLGLSPYLARKPAQLSGGQQQRVALGRAIISARPVCLMDEPLSNLDARLRNAMRAEIRALQQRLGFTMVYVTHDQTEAITMADQVVVLNEGRIEQAGPPQAVYERPETLFVARFIGAPPMNVLPLDVIVPGRGSDVYVGIRPEAIRFAAQGVKARVSEVEYHGADSLVDCAIRGTPVLVRSRADVPAGETAHLTWDDDDLHVFDAGGARRDDLKEEVSGLIAGANGEQSDNPALRAVKP